MPPQRYYFHIGGELTIRDPAGSEFSSEAAARRSAETRLRQLRAAASRRIKIVVSNTDGRVLFEVNEISDVTNGQARRESLIRKRARAIWERQGRPEGRAQEHWAKATQEIEAEGS